MTELTDEQINVAVAGWMGWNTLQIEAALRFKQAIQAKRKIPRSDSFSGLAAIEAIEKAEQDKDYVGPLPPYATSLDAMAQAEARLTAEQHRLFRKLLFSNAYNSGLCQTNDEAERQQVSAPARARARDLLAVVAPDRPAPRG